MGSFLSFKVPLKELRSLEGGSYWNLPVSIFLYSSRLPLNGEYLETTYKNLIQNILKNIDLWSILWVFSSFQEICHLQNEFVRDNPRFHCLK